MVVESVFTEQRVGLVIHVVGAFVWQPVNTDLFSCLVISKILENSIHSAALFGTQYWNLYTSPKNIFQKLHFPEKYLAETTLSRIYSTFP